MEFQCGVIGQHRVLGHLGGHQKRIDRHGCRVHAPWHGRIQTASHADDAALLAVMDEQRLPGAGVASSPGRQKAIQLLDSEHSMSRQKIVELHGTDF